tara:strand:+ start:2235 stop:2852 length:618 start_codon:yes stop_codon:yes gene_type:complete
MGTEDRNKSFKQGDKTSIVIKSFSVKDIPHIKKWCEYWKERGIVNNSSFDELRLERLLLTLLTYNKGELAAISGVERVTDEYRILVRAATTPHRPRVRGKHIEEGLWPWIGHASFEIQYVLDNFDNNAKFYTTTTVDDTNGRLRGSDRTSHMLFNTKRPFRCLHKNPRKITLWNVEQWAWYVDPHKCIEMCKDHLPNWKMIYDSL